jgi:hypothetical protein
MVWVLRFINIILLVVNFAMIFINPSNLKYTFAVLGAFSFISGIRKALIIGLDNLRGKFWVLLSLNAITIPISELLNSEVLHIISRFYLTLSIFFMLQGLLRQGFSLNRTKSVIWLLIIAISILLSFIFLPLIPQKLTSYLFLIALNINFALLVAVILIYLGSDLGLRWIIGTIGFLFYFVGDPLYLLNNPIYPFFWCLPYFFINIVAHMEE